MGVLVHNFKTYKLAKKFEKYSKLYSNPNIDIENYTM